MVGRVWLLSSSYLIGNFDFCLLDPKELKEASKIYRVMFLFKAFAIKAAPFPLILFQCIENDSNCTTPLLRILAICAAPKSVMLFFERLRTFKV